jgi:hypothetical protein
MTTPVAEPKEDGGVQVTVTLATPARRRKTGKQQETAGKASSSSRPQIPRITRLMALAIKFQGMLDCGAVRDYADLARLGYVTRARITQIMNLLNLAPEIQEDILDLAGPSTQACRVAERCIRSMTKIVAWSLQRLAWMELRSGSTSA